MITKNISISLLAALLAISCTTVKTAGQQGIAGNVIWITGNQMPGPDKKDDAGQGIVREILVYEALFMNAVQPDENGFYSQLPGNVVARTMSDADGTFKINLRPGKYSVFTKEENGLWANLFDGDGCIHCIEIQPNIFTPMTITINYTAAY